MSTSPSPAPEDPNEVHVPDDCLIIKYPILDPSQALENPTLVAVEEEKGPYDELISEKVYDTLSEIINLYEKIAINSFAISKSVVAHRMKARDLCYRDVFPILDKFYNDYPDTFIIPGTFLDPNHLKLFADKLSLHQQCAYSMKCLKEKLDNHLGNVEKNGGFRSTLCSHGNDVSDDKVISPDKRKKKRKLKKKKKEESEDEKEHQE